MEQVTYTVSEATKLISDSLTTQTFYSWIRKIEVYTPKYFLRAVDKENPFFAGGEPRPQIQIQEKELVQFQKLYKLRQRGVRLEKAIFEAFLRKEDYDFLRENEWNYKLLKEKVVNQFKERKTNE